MKVLVVVDVQNDFIEGSLGSENAINAIPYIRAKIEDYIDEDSFIFFTMDTHQKATYANTQEGKKLPVEHCIDDTWGHYISDLLDLPDSFFNGKKVFTCLKNTFGTNMLCYNIDEIISANYCKDKNVTIEVIGIDTAICVASNVTLLKTYFPETKIVVDAKCCASSDTELHRAALKVMQAQQVEVINYN